MKDYQRLDSLLARESRVRDVLNQKAENLGVAIREEHEARLAFLKAHNDVEQEMDALRKGGN